MTEITIVDRPCGFGKSSNLIDDLLKADSRAKIFLVVPELGEVERFEEALQDAGFKSPVVDPEWVKEGGADNKTDVLIEMLSMGKNIVTTHALYANIKRFDYLLTKYNVIIDEVPTVAEQVPVMFGSGVFKNLLHDKKYISIDPVTKLITATDNWLLDQNEYYSGTDTDIKRFMDKIQNTDVYYIAGVYCLMPLPDAFFTKPKSLTILTFMFEGTQLQHYMLKRGYECTHNSCDEALTRFKYQMNRDLKLYKKSSDVKAGYEKMTDKKGNTRKKVGNFMKNALKNIRGSGHSFDTESILVACSKDAWFGSELSKNSRVSLATRLKTTTRLGKATYTAMITRGTNKFKDKNILILMGKVNIHPNLADFLGMNTKRAKDQYTLSELIQLIYRTAIRDKKETFLISADQDNIRLLKQFINS